MNRPRGGGADPARTGRLVRPAARARRPFVTGWHHGVVADQGSGSGYEPSLGCLTSMAVRILLLVGLVLTIPVKAQAAHLDHLEG